MALPFNNGYNNFNIPPMQPSFMNQTSSQPDLDGYYVNNESEARNRAVTANKPVLFFEKDNDVFYMLHNGVMRKYVYQEAKDENTTRFEQLESQIANLSNTVTQLVNALGGVGNEPVSNNKQ